MATPNLLRGLLGQAALIFRRQDLAGHRGSRLHHQPADLPFEFGEHALVVLGGGFACLDHDQFRGRDGLLRFPFLQAGGGGPGLLDELGRLGIRLRHHFLTLGFGLGQLRLYLLCIGQALSDLLAPYFQHREDRSIGEPVQDQAHDAEADDLGEQMGPVHAEGRENRLGAPAINYPGLGHQWKNIHHVSSAPGKFCLSHQEQGIEHDRFGEGNGQNRLDQNLRCSAGITSDCFRRFHADQTNPNGRAKRRQTNV